MNNIKNSIKLATLAGEHELSGCDLATEQVHDWGETFVSAGVIRFVLDGKVYEAIESPDDGYRSSLEGLQLADADKVVQNSFTPIKVLGVYVDQETDEYSTRHHDILELRRVSDGEVVLKVGTADTDDYYPGCVMAFNSELAKA